MILLDLLDSLVDAETMALMHHVVADRKFGEAADLLSLVIVLFPLLLPFFHAKHIALGDDDKFDQRVFKALMELSVSDQDLPRSHRLSRVFRTERPQVILP